jgi:hypothetical protein
MVSNIMQFFYLMHLTVCKYAQYKHNLSNEKEIGKSYVTTCLVTRLILDSYETR